MTDESRGDITFAIVGRPNVGKSTLFNRMATNRKALVDNQPGVTRDVREADADLAGLKFRIADTAGMDIKPNPGLEQDIRDMTDRAVANSDVCLMVVDARSGLLPVDRDIAAALHRMGKRCITIVNKCDGKFSDVDVSEYFVLGFGTPVPISAEHSLGMGDLYITLSDLLEELCEPVHAKLPAGIDDGEENGAVEDLECIKVAILGRPNCGKSSLVNRILGEQRLLTADQPGTTRDAISFRLDWLGQEMEIHDTAGLRKRARVTERLEMLSNQDGLRAVRFSEVVMVMVDARHPFEIQDLRIASLAETEGRAVVIAVNKWDLVRNGEARRRELAETLESKLPKLRGVTMVTISALTGYGLEKLNLSIREAYRTWNRRLTTGVLNRWLEHVVIRHPPPLVRGRRIRLRYITQIKARPPSFVIMCSRPRYLNAGYRRYLVNSMREEFELYGTPIRLYFRSNRENNPYV